MNVIQRDLGRVEAKVEILQVDVTQIKQDLADIKLTLNGNKSVKDSDWKRLSVVAVMASIVTSIFNWVKPFIT